MDDSDRLHSWLHRHDDDLRLPSVLRYLVLLFLGTFVFSEGTPVGSSAIQHCECVIVRMASCGCDRACVLATDRWPEPFPRLNHARFPTLLNTRPAFGVAVLLLLGPL